MAKLQLSLLSHQWLSLLLFAGLFDFSNGDVGSAAVYSPPYLPTACYGNDVSEIPATNLFAAASEGIWDNGAACGRQYLVRCLSAAVVGTCVTDEIIQVKIVDRVASLISHPSKDGATMVLSTTAFGTITQKSASSINVEFQQV